VMGAMCPHRFVWNPLARCRTLSAMSSIESAVLIDGEPQQCLTVTDRALHYGDGVFETLAIRAGRPRLWTAHMERLLQGCSRLGIPIPDLQCLAAECQQLCGDGGDAVLKIIISRGSGGRGYRAPARPLPRRILLRYPWPEQPDWQQGVRLIHCQTPLGCNPVLAGIKHLNRIEQVLARNEWQDEAVYEGLMCDPDGYLVEGTMSNVFALKDGVLHTPDLSRCGVHGVMRRQVLALAEQHGMPCRHGRITPSELAGMDEVFITNSLIGIAPVNAIADTVFSINQGLALRQALEAWLEGK
jgi:4-amino-4-deoxychorismate lyase